MLAVSLRSFQLGSQNLVSCKSHCSPGPGSSCSDLRKRLRTWLLTARNDNPLVRKAPIAKPCCPITKFQHLLIKAISTFVALPRLCEPDDGEKGTDITVALSRPLPPALPCAELESLREECKGRSKHSTGSRSNCAKATLRSLLFPSCSGQEALSIPVR